MIPLLKIRQKIKLQLLSSFSQSIMLNFFWKRTLHSAKFSPFNLSPAYTLHFLQFYLFSSASAKTPKSKSINANGHSFAANYLINKFGFSKERALIASKQINFRSSETPDAIIAFLKKHGFSDAQISRNIRKSPTIFNLKPDSNLLPKIEFFQSLGMSSVDIAEIITSGRSVLVRSLEKQIIPSFNFVKSLVESHEDAIDTIKRFPTILQVNLQSTVPPNVESLRKAGVPEVKILHIFKNYPRYFMISPDKFSQCVENIKEMGFNPLKTNFVKGLYVMRMLSRSNWDKKMEVYKRWGFSESQVLAAFRNYPWFMAISEDKIERVMNCIINKMSCEPLIILGSPQLIALSLEKTIIPRCSVYQVLKSKGLIRKNASLLTFLKYSKKSFFEKFIQCFVEEIPELLKLYPQTLYPSK